MAKASPVDTSQLAGSSDETVCMFRVGSFNVDIDQNMRTGKRCRQHGRKIEYILTTSVQDAGLQFVDLCELDSLRQKLLLGVPSVDVRLAEPTADGDSNSTTDTGACESSDADPVSDEDHSRPCYLQWTNNKISITSSKPPLRMRKQQPPWRRPEPPLRMCKREPPLRGSVCHDLTPGGERPSPSSSDPEAPEHEYITPKKAYPSEERRRRKILAPAPKKTPLRRTGAGGVGFRCG